MGGTGQSVTKNKEFMVLYLGPELDELPSDHWGKLPSDYGLGMYRGAALDVVAAGSEAEVIDAIRSIVLVRDRQEAEGTLWEHSDG